ncbi:MAG: hypothetical protein IJJ33_04430 [Victivallales bacterium]|nr:hypothetical protein [Victivallales bacterium]
MDWEQKSKLAEEMELGSASLLKHLPAQELNYVCNGIGPSWFPTILREAVTKLHKSLAIAADIHDLRYWNGTGTDEDFHDANAEFLDNGLKLAEHFYGWYDPRRYLARASAKNFYRLLEIGGRVAYNKAIAEREAQGK